jgi:D-threo-aldose 1-dehydrogenase
MTATKNLPTIIFGTSCLGNIYEVVPLNTKLEIVKACVDNTKNGLTIFDSAGKYGAGMALKTLGNCLKALNVPEDKVLISNKLGWFQTELLTPQPTFEPGIWKDITHDAILKISYDGIIECFEQGNKLLGNYNAQMLSVHDPDEYLNASINKADEEKRFKDILDAYRALYELKINGKATSVGIGAKNWQLIKRVTEHINLDWIMIANSLTLFSHPKELLTFVQDMQRKGIKVINAGIFNGGFLTGSEYYNYEFVDKSTSFGNFLYAWRNKFFTLCKDFNITPAEAAFRFSASIPGIQSVAISTSKPQTVKLNFQMATKSIPQNFWKSLATTGLIENSFPYLTYL